MGGLLNSGRLNRTPSDMSPRLLCILSLLFAFGDGLPQAPRFPMAVNSPNFNLIKVSRITSKSCTSAFKDLNFIAFLKLLFNMVNRLTCFQYQAAPSPSPTTTPSPIQNQEFFQVYQPVLKPKYADCEVLLMEHQFAFSYGQPFVGELFRSVINNLDSANRFRNVHSTKLHVQSGDNELYSKI